MSVSAIGKTTYSETDNERFVGFAFAGANLLVEVGESGTVTYAAGAFRTEFGRDPDAFVGDRVQNLVSLKDREFVTTALQQLIERGRLLPISISLSNKQATRLALAGIALPSRSGRQRLCLTFASLPAPSTTIVPTSPHQLARAAEERLRAGPESELVLIELEGTGHHPNRPGLDGFLRSLSPTALSCELGTGKFGVLRPVAAAGAPHREVGSAILGVPVRSESLPLEGASLPMVQAVRALRQALSVFTRKGLNGLQAESFDQGLAGYVARATDHAGAVRRQIETNDFELAYQPIVSLADRTLHHYEALIRPKPLVGVHSGSPQEFVLLVEALGLSTMLDMTVGRLACEAASRSGCRIAFNVSSQSVQSSAFRARITDMLGTDAAVKAGLISVEMTETAEIDDVEEAAKTVKWLREAGIEFCLDDFGAGTADVRVLRALGADVVKLDGSYTAEAVDGGREHAFVAGMVGIARAACAKTVAERIELDAEAEAMRAMGVDYGQGWLFGRAGPLPTPETSKTARRRGSKESWG